LRAKDISRHRSDDDVGPLRGLNPGPPAPEAGIIPLDQADILQQIINGEKGVHRHYIFYRRKGRVFLSAKFEHINSDHLFKVQGR
jgi:hypothetical protein